MARPRVLITGFGPFPGAPENPSAWLVNTLAQGALGALAECILHSDVLPTEWAEVASRGPRLFRQHRPDLVLHFGLNKRAQGFHIERSAHNVIALKEDACGALPARRRVVEGSDARLDTAISPAKLARHLRERHLPASASRSAGTYLCNYLYYLSLHLARDRQDPCSVVFVHLPPDPRQGGPLSEAELLRGGEIILRYLLTHLLESRQAKVIAGGMAAGSRVTVVPS